MDMIALARALAALVLTIGLLLGLAWAARRFGWLSGLPVARTAKRLALQEILVLDPRTRLLLVTFDGAEHVLAVGPNGANWMPMTAQARAPDQASQTDPFLQPANPASAVLADAGPAQAGSTPGHLAPHQSPQEHTR